jgi:hypothetical protein
MGRDSCPALYSMPWSSIGHCRLVIVALYPDHLALLSGRQYVPLANVFSPLWSVLKMNSWKKILTIMILMTRHERLPWYQEKTSSQYIGYDFSSCPKLWSKLIEKSTLLVKLGTPPEPRVHIVICVPSNAVKCFHQMLRIPQKLL